MASVTVGFSIDKEDLKRLDELTRRFGGGNRSAFLRAALDHMQRLARAERLSALQRYGVQRSAELGLLDVDVPDAVKQTMRKKAPKQTPTIREIENMVVSSGKG